MRHAGDKSRKRGEHISRAYVPWAPRKAAALLAMSGAGVVPLSCFQIQRAALPCETSGAKVLQLTEGRLRPWSAHRSYKAAPLSVELGVGHGVAEVEEVQEALLRLLALDAPDGLDLVDGSRCCHCCAAASLCLRRHPTGGQETCPSRLAAAMARGRHVRDICTPAQPLL